MGLSRAGFEVWGLDRDFQPRYPFPTRFCQGDVREVLHNPRILRRFDFIWASPPCQKHSKATQCHGTQHRQAHECYIEEVRTALLRAGVPFVIENVPGAPLLNPTMLCGAMFPPLRVYRHRLFEAHGFPLTAPPHPKHGAPNSPQGVRLLCGYEPNPITPTNFVCVVGHIKNIPLAREAMGIPWMNGREITQAIPPAYAEYIGRQFVKFRRSSAHKGARR